MKQQLKPQAVPTPGRARMRTGARGFTMIELIVVMAVIGLLLSIAVPRYFNSLERGKAQVQRQNLALMREAIDKFYGDHARYPDRLDDLVTQRYLRAIPVDPLTEKSDWVVIGPDDAGLGGVYDVASAQPASVDAAGGIGTPGGQPGDAEATGSSGRIR